MTELIPKTFPRGYVKPGDEVTFVLRDGEVVNDTVDVVTPLITCSSVMTRNGTLANILHETRAIIDPTDIVDISIVESAASPKFDFRESASGDVGVFVGSTCIYIIQKSEIANSSYKVEQLRAAMSTTAVETQHTRAMLALWSQFREWHSARINNRRTA